MKKIFYFIVLFFLVSCSIINDNKIYENNVGKEIKVDDFLGINKEKQLKEDIINNTGNINKKPENNNEVLNEIEDIENEINILLEENNVEAIDIINENSEEDIESLIDNLFENVN